jgi:PAT family beta-lactamase induction signal transducer AmpG
MTLKQKAEKSWRAFLQPKIITFLWLGFAAGIPFSLIFSTLSLWLVEAGIEVSTVTFFSWAGLAYSFKFIWAPLVDRLPVPLLTQRFGQRRGWLLTAQIMIIIAIVSMAFTNPASSHTDLILMALLAVLLGFSSATQDIVIDALRIESAKVEQQALLASSYIAGYRLAMITSGAGALFLAEFLGSTKEHYQYSAWQLTYLAMAALMTLGAITTLAINEPQRKTFEHKFTNQQYLSFLVFFAVCIVAFAQTYSSVGPLLTPLQELIDERSGNSTLAGFVKNSIQFLSSLSAAIACGWLLSFTPLFERQLVKDHYYEPIADFFQRYGKKLALLLLVFIGCYRISDIVLGVIANVFYLEIGFSKEQIAQVSKTFGLLMMIAGGFIGGALSIRFGVLKTLFLGALLTVLTNLLFMILAQVGNDLGWLYIIISADNITAGLASAAFIAFLASLTNVSFTASQYAIFSSLMTLFPKIIGGYSGSMVESIGYTQFFLVASLMGVPVLFLIIWLSRLIELKETQ